MQLGQSEEAAAMFRRAIAVDTEHVKAMGNLAALLVASKRHAEAVVLLERALTTLGSSDEIAQGKLPADLAVALGGAHEATFADERAASSSASLEAAHRAYSRALRAHPSHAEAKARLTRLVRSPTISCSFADVPGSKHAFATVLTSRRNA
jgi:Tfp pilus assembly protein PilF